MKRIAVLFLMLVMAMNILCVVPAQAESIVDVTDYTYKVTPILSPFAYCLYVETDNPDPSSFRLVDENSKFFTEESQGEIALLPEGNVYRSKDVEPGTYYNSVYRYEDVTYENKTTGRVSGGYIFIARRCYSDGGEFTLMQKTASGESILSDKFEKTSIKIPCKELVEYDQYLIDTCTTESMDFFEKLDAVQKRLDEIAVYPRSVFDIDKPNNEHPYPLLAASPYAELMLNEHYSMYEYSKYGMLASGAYPFILDSLSFPGTIGAIAKTLEPECEISSGGVHWSIDITFAGINREYGGAGSGGNTPIRSDKIRDVFTFRKGAELGLESTIENFRDKLMSYESIAEEDISEYKDQIEGETYYKTIEKTGGTWIRVCTEGWFGYGTTFTYAVPHASSVKIASDAWVDGRYVNKWERVELDAKFEDHPKADIIKRNVSYTDRNGQKHVQDVIYSYNENDDNWTAPMFYSNAYWWISGEQLPPELILSRAEAEKLVKGNYVHSIPDKGLIYDGTEPPGTPFTTVNVTGIELPKNAEVEVGGEAILTATVTPPNAYDGRVNWTSSNEDIVKVSGHWNSNGATLYGKAEGTAVITATTVDGSLTATCTVTVKRKEYPISGKITSFGDATEETWLVLQKTGGATFYTAGNTNYVFDEEISKGAYTLIASKTGHATREYDVTVSDKAVTQDVKICLYGDVDMNGERNMLDIQKIFAFIKNNATITDAYQIKLADMDENKDYNMLDIQRLFAAIKAA